MGDKFTKVVMFAAGAGIGAAVGALIAWKVTATKYQQIIEEQDAEYYNAMKQLEAAFDEVINSDSDEEVDPDESVEESDTHEEESRPVIAKVLDYNDVIVKYGYDKPTREIEALKPEGEKSMFDREMPVIIPPEEFGEDYEYSTVTLTCYADKVVTDEWDEVLTDEDIEKAIGRDAINHFGDYEEDPDTVYVRNDELQVYYEILRDLKPYSDYEDYRTDK